MTGKIYKVVRPDRSITHVVIFSKGDYFFNPTNNNNVKLNNILKGKYLNRPSNYVQYVQKEGYRLKYLGLTTTFSINYPEFFI